MSEHVTADAVEHRRAEVRKWLDTMLDAIDPRLLVAEALADQERALPVIAIGKASIAMTRGAADVFGRLRGVCVSNEAGDVPAGIELIVGDHPVPGPGSLEAGRRVLDFARLAGDTVLALISGGGSALCEKPRSGLDMEYLDLVNRILLDAGAPITEMNLIRQHLSEIKCGGLARACAHGVKTLVIADVAGAGPEIIASGPTIPSSPDPAGALALMERYGIPIDAGVERAVQADQGDPGPTGAVTLLADGRMAASAIVESAMEEGVAARLADGWITGDVESRLRQFIDNAGPGVTVAAGEPDVGVSGAGWGGRNTHAALLAANRIAGSTAVFAAFATDGVDGRTDTAGAIVDGQTIARGGNPKSALRGSDSGTYLETTGDLVRTGPTGTNVSDVWVLWND